MVLHRKHLSNPVGQCVLRCLRSRHLKHLMIPSGQSEDMWPARNTELLPLPFRDTRPWPSPDFYSPAKLSLARTVVYKIVITSDCSCVTWGWFDMVEGSEQDELRDICWGVLYSKAAAPALSFVIKIEERTGIRLGKYFYQNCTTQQPLVM